MNRKRDGLLLQRWKVCIGLVPSRSMKEGEIEKFIYLRKYSAILSTRSDKRQRQGAPTEQENSEAADLRVTYRDDSLVVYGGWKIWEV